MVHETYSRLLQQEQAKRLKTYAVDYAMAAWQETVDPSPDELVVMGVRADMYSDAHVQSGCACGDSAEKCGEMYAAMEYVESQEDPEAGNPMPRYPEDGVSPLDW